MTKGARGVRQKVIFHDEGGRGVRQKVILYDKGGLGSDKNVFCPTTKWQFLVSLLL